jgi:outer membrane protein OmpA-like peptidoglycan-associated protein
MRSRILPRSVAAPPGRRTASLLLALLLGGPAAGPLLLGGCAGRASATSSDALRGKRVVVRSGRIDTIHPVNFDLNSARLSSDSEPLLDEVAEAIKAALKLSRKVRIEGHTDELGTRQYNLDLSRKRAEVVKTYLIGRGVPGANLEAVGHGEGKPMADNSTETGRAQNRRVEFILVK